jgi:hypothetical protein
MAPQKNETAHMKPNSFFPRPNIPSLNSVPSAHSLNECIMGLNCNKMLKYLQQQLQRNL